MKRVLIFFPRLDLPFKKPLGTLINTQPIQPIRAFWQFFLDKLGKEIHADDVVEVIEGPMWEFTEKEVFARALPYYDLVYLPHKSRKFFNAPENVMFYMQTVFPMFFTIDKEGICGNASYSPLLPAENETYVHVPFLLKRWSAGHDKFGVHKSTGKKFEKDHITFNCQLPHDQVIKECSNVGVALALKVTLEAAKQLKLHCRVRGHPLNPESQEHLRTLQASYPNTSWIDPRSETIQDTFNQDSLVALSLVNSGSGMEAMLHGVKRIITFGDCEYKPMTYHAEFPEDIISACIKPKVDHLLYLQWLETFIDRYTIGAPSPINTTFESKKLWIQQEKSS